MVEDVARDDHHNHESRDEEQRLPHIAGKQRARGEDDGRDTSDDGGCEADDESRDGGPHAHDEQDDEEYRQTHGREERQQADEEGCGPHDEPDISDHAVNERADLALGGFSACEPHQQPSQHGQQQPQVVPARVPESDYGGPYDDCRDDGGIAPRQ